MSDTFATEKSLESNMATSDGKDSMGTVYPSIIELNIGGVFYTTSLKTLTRYLVCLLIMAFLL